MINYTLTIDKIELIYVNESMPDYVKFMFGILSAENLGITMSMKITSTVPTIDVQHYIPYPDLTEQQALDIFYASIDPDYYQLCKDELSNQINEVFTNQNQYVKPLPWLQLKK